ncbi:TonB-dependent siderophore receptor [Caulobacter sp. Root1472]|uniref:TonB-dependent receptor plug domain-containing protein n=1 Tax=Caulobacter sp. Root1472 TaxID=1736470 RepID=UPI0007005A57|nr:TonB-dependent receptor [Caulobacter sp. Root1472]KQZ30662.1 TonB-dependent receptor [Caulobacter sp. Root1472]
MSLASVVFALGLAAPEAQAAAPPATPAGPLAVAAPAADAQRGVTAYPPDFFAEQRPSTAFDMITRLPGFRLDRGDEARGFAGTAGNVLVNGERPTTKSDNLEDILKRISASAVERVELIRGGAPGIDMQGQTILANVVIKSTVQVEKVANIQTYLYPDGLFGPLLEFQASRRDGINEIEGSLKATVDRTDQTFDGGSRVTSFPDGRPTIREAVKGYDQIQNYAARGAIQRAAPGGKIRVNGKIEYFSFDRDVVYTRYQPSPGRQDSGETSKEWTGEFGARYDARLGPRTDLQLVFLQNLGDETYGSTLALPGHAEVYRERDKTGESILRGEVKHRRSQALSLEGSVEGAYNFLDGDIRYDVNGAPVDIGPPHVKVEELRGEAAGKAVWRANPKLTIEAGARMEVSRITQSGGGVDVERSFFYPKPRVLATWSPNSVDQLRVRVEREVGQLDFGDFIASADLAAGSQDGADVNLEPQRSWVGEVAWERRFWGAGSLSTTLTHAEISDVVDYKPLVGGGDAPSNIGSGRSDQFVIALTLPTQRLGISGGQVKARLSWFDSEVTDPVTFHKRRITNATPFVCNLSFTRDMPGGKWSWGASRNCPNEYSRFRLGEVRTQRFEPYLEGFVEWKPSPDLTVRTTLSNWTSRNVTRERVIYKGSRADNVVDRIEYRSLPFEPYLFIQVRKRLG